MEIEIKEKIKVLHKKIEELQSRLPAHSIPPAMIAQLDELEEELAYWVAQQNSLEDEHPPMTTE